MGGPATQPLIPRGALFGAAALVGIAVLSAGTARFTGVGTLNLKPAAAEASRELRFEDRNDGAIVVSDAQTQRVIAVLAPGTNGFVRGVMRSLAHERTLRGIGEEAPFRLELGNDHRLLLSDPSTGRLIALNGFGATNAEAFARFLSIKDGTS